MFQAISEAIQSAETSLHLPDWFPDHSPTMWGWHTVDPNRNGTDLVTLTKYQDYLDDPTLIVSLMEGQGLTNVTSVEIGDQMSGGTSSNNYKAYINWTDGTQTKCLLKGRREGEAATASYRESLFYSRLADSMEGYIQVPAHYLAVADVESGDALFLEEFMTGYDSLQDIYVAYFNGTLNDYGIDPDTFDLLQSQKDVFYMLGRFQGSHWMDESLFSEFWMKNYDEVQGHGRYDQTAQKAETQAAWHLVKKAVASGEINLSQNSIDCIQAVMDAWSYKDVIAEWQKPSYRWGLTHGDFHCGQILANPDDLSDMVLADWEFVGMMGNPSKDMVTWIVYNPGNYAYQHEEELVFENWLGLVSVGVDPNDYNFDQAWSDYKIYGSTEIVTSYMVGLGLTIGKDSAQWLADQIDSWFTRLNLTPDMMVTPTYGLLDFKV